MFAKKAVFAALIAAGTLGAVATPLPAVAETDFGVQFNFGAPPPVRYEAVQAPHRGYVEAPGHWQWNGRRYVWVEHARWYPQPSRWDRDGDGIPNRGDPTPNGRGPRWDRDNDGVPNRYDPNPDNAYYR